MIVDINTTFVAFTYSTKLVAELLGHTNRPMRREAWYLNLRNANKIIIYVKIQQLDEFSLVVSIVLSNVSNMKFDQKFICGKSYCFDWTCADILVGAFRHFTTIDDCFENYNFSRIVVVGERQKEDRETDAHTYKKRNSLCFQRPQCDTYRQWNSTEPRKEKIPVSHEV